MVGDTHAQINPNSSTNLPNANDPVNKNEPTNLSNANDPADGNDPTNLSEDLTPEPKPMYKAKIIVQIDNEDRPTLCDTGCEKTCISERFLRQHPNLYKNVVRPFKGNTISIDGSKVETIGIINISFRIKGRYMRMNCRIVRNLVYNFVLGWDFFCKYDCAIHPAQDDRHICCRRLASCSSGCLQPPRNLKVSFYHQLQLQ